MEKFIKNFGREDTDQFYRLLKSSKSEEELQKDIDRALAIMLIRHLTSDKAFLLFHTSEEVSVNYQLISKTIEAIKTEKVLNWKQAKKFYTDLKGD